MRIDVRGMGCPQPVLMTKKAIDNKPEQIEILVDNTTAKNNVERFLKSRAYEYESLNELDDMLIKAKKK